ncbi:n-terminal binuclear zn cluster-containing [Trichoderma cornu-damae]|uniref:N-terminal binuclear zn cluster-containing n=1 Tax=Trichoderma cornu-damae TaxID=654480 RepID=A0A9P8QN81_9HYPO|nr:n-terminal binuclear zn cluster-containing [Trichoderma cornu-damae]
MLVPSVESAKVKRVLEQGEKEQRRDQARQPGEEERAKPSVRDNSTPKGQADAKSHRTRDTSSSPPVRLAASTIPVFQQDDSDFLHDEAWKGDFAFPDDTIDPSQIGYQISHDGSSSPWGHDCDKTAIFGLQPPRRFVPYSSYNFVDAGFLNQLSHTDVSYLEEKGCLTLPSESALEEFFHQYFAHVHPIIPLLSEAEFWALDARIPLLLIRAILFIASPVRPDNGLMGKAQALPDTPMADPTITLTQFDIHKSNVVNAQVAVMLTYYSPTPSDTTNTYWMVNAVHFSRCARADQYYTLSDNNPTRLVLKRLWWSCILRDRVMSLSLRRPLTIGSDEFDFSLPGLNLADFSDELGASTVYDRPTRQILAHMMSAFCELVIPLTKALTILYPAAGPKVIRAEIDTRQDSDACVETLWLLDMWYRKTRERFEMSTPSIGVHKSLTLFTKMTFIYYYHASDAQKSDLQVQAEMDSALKGITGIFMHLARLGLVQYLPNTFVSFSATPLIWQVLDAKMLNTGALAADNMRDLMVYTNVMNKFRSLHENANNLLKFIKQIIAHIQTTESVEINQHELLADTCFPPELLSSFLPGGMTPEVDSGPKSKWAKLFAGKPRTYLRIALTIQHALSSGNFPSEEDFPKALQTAKFAEDVTDSGVDVGLYRYLQHMEDFLLSA